VLLEAGVGVLDEEEVEVVEGGVEAHRLLKMSSKRGTNPRLRLSRK
jgi:hypothetical protein